MGDVAALVAIDGHGDRPGTGNLRSRMASTWPCARSHRATGFVMNAVSTHKPAQGPSSSSTPGTASARSTTTAMGWYQRTDREVGST